LVDKAAFDFSETEVMLKAAEELCGPYVWGVYDILVLPPSFPYGGMENPCLTFATPTLLVNIYVTFPKSQVESEIIFRQGIEVWQALLLTR